MKLLDVFDVFEEFQQALTDPALDEFDGDSPSAEAKEAAARLAAALGFCRLLGIDPDEDDGTLPVPEALGAAEAVFQWALNLKSQAEKLPCYCARSREGVEIDLFCADLLEDRMQIWAAEIALTEAALSAMDSADPLADELNAKLDELAIAVDTLDAKIRSKKVLQLLSRLADTALLENWRQALAKPYAIVLPYWLDGTLEVLARRNGRKVR